MQVVEDLFKLIRSDAEELERQFRDASTQGRGTPQDIAEFRENALQGFLKDYFPFPYRVAKGGIVDRDGERSDSVDCILVHPDHPYTITRHARFRIILADGVDVAIEVKPDIASASELQRDLEQGLTVKALRHEGPFSLSHTGDTPELLEHSKRVPYFIFAMRAKSDWRNTAADILEFYKSRGAPPLDQADAIVINGVGILANFPVSGRYPWEIIPEYGRDTGWFFEGWGQNTLAGLLFKINTLIPPRTNLDAPILSRYLSTKLLVDRLVALEPLPDNK